MAKKLLTFAPDVELTVSVLILFSFLQQHVEKEGKIKASSEWINNENKATV